MKVETSLDTENKVALIVAKLIAQNKKLSGLSGLNTSQDRKLLSSLIWKLARQVVAHIADAGIAMIAPQEQEQYVQGWSDYDKRDADIQRKHGYVGCWACGKMPAEHESYGNGKPVSHGYAPGAYLADGTRKIIVKENSEKGVDKLDEA